MEDFPIIYRRNLPHRQPYRAILFFTYRLHGSLPRAVLEKLRQQRKAQEKRLRQKQANLQYSELRDRVRRRIFLKFDQALNHADSGPTWLAIPNIAEVVKEAMFHRHTHRYDMVCFTIMANHCHQIVINTRPDIPIYETLGELKSYTAHQANPLLGRKGSFWQRESFDHVIRTGRLKTTMSYVMNNPVHAGLVTDWRAWPHSWVNPRFESILD